MGKECFTCSHKLSRDLSDAERKELQRQHVREHGRPTLFIPEMEFTCDVSKKQIHQTDPACEHYEGHPILVRMRKQLSETAKRLREELE